HSTTLHISTRITPTKILTLSLHDALPISIVTRPSGMKTCCQRPRATRSNALRVPSPASSTTQDFGLKTQDFFFRPRRREPVSKIDRKSTRLNYSHLGI